MQLTPNLSLPLNFLGLNRFKRSVAEAFQILDTRVQDALDAADAGENPATMAASAIEVAAGGAITADDLQSVLEALDTRIAALDTRVTALEE